MNKLTAVFPAALAAFLLLVFSEYLPLLRRDTLPVPRRERWTRRDSLAVICVTAAYAIVAFLGLGDTQGVESFCKFGSRGEYALIELPEGTALGEIRYYSGLYMGNYYVQVSADGEAFTDVGKMRQNHTDVFKWNTFTPEDGPITGARYLRLIADKPLWLGELALYDTDGARIDAAALRYDRGCGALFDEQELVPEKKTYANSSYFDEIYHARTAYEHIENIDPYEISHPPLGKLLIAVGIRIFGLNPFGWRFTGTLLGVLMLPLLYLFLKSLCGGFAVPLCGTLIFAADFMHFVQTRIATIDTYPLFFTLLMYLFFWGYWKSERTQRRDWLPPLALSGVCFGLAAASKWTGFYAGAGLGVLWLLDRIFRGAALCRAGQKKEYLRETRDNVLWCLLFFVCVPALIYYLSYWRYGTAAGLRGPGMLFKKEYFDIVWDNQKYMLHYHAGVKSEHPYSSVWWQWMLDIRPILYYLDYLPDGRHVSFGAWLNPLLCWGGLLPMLCMLYQSIFKRDKTALFILIGYLAQLLPWVFVPRVLFEYHYFPSSLFLLLALCHVLRGVREYKSDWRHVLWGVTGTAVGLFVLFYPALAGRPVSSFFGHSFLKWLPSWPF